MRLLIDLRLAGYQPAGIGRSAVRLAAALVRGGSDLDVTALTAARGRPIDLPPGIIRRTVHTPPHWRWEMAALARELGRERWDVVHWPDFVPGARGLGRTVLTVHDLAFLRRSDLLTAASGRYYERVKAEARRADGVIAVSAATRRDVVETLGVCPERVYCVPHGLDAEFRPDAQPDDPAVVARYGLGDPPAAPYLLFVGTLEPRKNLLCLIEAFDLARREGLDPEIRLVLAGAPGWLADSLYRAAYTSASRQRLVFTGRVPDSALPALYRRAAALVLPSLEEGFGLPVLEALGCGTPVICSDLPALREVAGDAARYCPVGDRRALAAALVETLSRPAETRARRERGLARAAAFTWDAAAEAALRVYRRMADEPRCA